MSLDGRNRSDTDDGSPAIEGLGHKVRRLHTALIADWAAHAGASGVPLTQTQAGILLLVGRLPGITQVLLADRLAVEAPTLSQGLRPLVAQGLIERRHSRRDGRMRELYLTTPGSTLAERVSEFLDAREQRLRQVIPACDLEQLHRIIDALLAHGAAGGALLPPPEARP